MPSKPQLILIWGIPDKRSVWYEEAILWKQSENWSPTDRTAASLLILGMDLRPGPVMPVSQAAPVLSATRSISRDLDSAYAIITRREAHLGAKACPDCRAPSRVYRLFQQLEPKTRRDVLALYDKSAGDKKAIQTGKQQHGSEP